MIFKSISREALKKEVNSFIALLSAWKYATWGADNFLYELPKKWNFSFDVREENELLGFCFASNKLPGVFYIHLIFISSQARGNSLGTKMLEHAKKIALQHSINCIELRCPETNEGALAFYKKHGFKIKNKLHDEISGTEADYYLRLDF